MSNNLLIIGVMTLLLSSVVIVWTSENVSASTTYTVNSSGGGDFMTITDAVNAASDDDIIQVAPGTGYVENIVINKKLTIEGTGGMPKVSGLPMSSSPVFDIRVDDVTIDYLEIIGTSTSSVAGIKSSALAGEENNVLIIDCEIHGFSNGGYGVCVERRNPEDSYPTHNVVDHCEIYECNIGISIESDPADPQINSNHIVRKCYIHDISQFTGTMGHGIYNHGDENTFEDTHIYNCGGKGLYIYDSYKCDVLDKDTFGYPFYIHNTNTGIYVLDCDDCTISGDDSNRLLRVTDSLDDGIYVEDSVNCDLYYLDIDENTGYGIFFDGSDSNSLRFSSITDNDYVFEGDHKGNYLYLCESSTNLLEDNTIDETSGSSSLYVTCGSDYNYIDGNSLDGDIFIGGSDENTITDMEFDYVEINGGEDNTIQYCDISNSYATLVYLFEADDTYIYRTNLDGVDDEDTGIYIKDSQDVEISGYEAGEDPSTIENCDIVLYVKSEDISCSVYFHHYSISDSNGGNNDIELYGTASQSTTGTYNDLSGGPEHYTDAYSTWTLVV